MLLVGRGGSCGVKSLSFGRRGAALGSGTFDTFVWDEPYGNKDTGSPAGAGGNGGEDGGTPSSYNNWAFSIRSSIKES